MTRKPLKKSKRQSSSRKRSAAPVAPAQADPLDAMIEASAHALGIKIDQAWMPAIRANLQVTFRLGAVVTALPLPDDTEPGPVFRA